MADTKLYKFTKRDGEYVYYELKVATGDSSVQIEQKKTETQAANVQWLKENVEGYQVIQESMSQGSTTSTAAAGADTMQFEPTDPRMIWGAFDNVLSFSAFDSERLVDGFVVEENAAATTDGKRVATQNLTKADVDKYAGFEQFLGVPAIMNPNAYIGFQQFRGSKDQKYLAKLIDQANQPRWYEVDVANAEKTHRYKSPTVSEIVAWSQEADNVKKTPYRFQDFAYCKYFGKIPNNYLITLRRYPYPTSDNLEGAGENSAKGKQNYEAKQLLPVAQAITWLGEATGNKISSLLGGIESGLNWKDIKSEMNVVSPATPGDAGAGPAPGLAKWVGLISGDYNSTTNPNQGAAPDPYTEGTWNNKIIGNVNVIDSTKARERGLKFSHKIDLVFEYEARSIGGINTKAAMLDIMSNLLLMTSATANFWGGANRFRPGSPGNTAPFLGGPAGRAAFMRGDPVGFMNAVTDQFSKAASAISDFLFSAMQDPFTALKSLAAGGAKAFMNSNKTPGGHVSGLKAILTGDPVGEWHLTVGNPFNPMMMIGNLICTGIKLEFNEELGPDDFPTELKATISLDHGMPRDRDAIESMFNGGGGRLYSLPKGFEESFTSASMSKVDSHTGGGKRKLGSNSGANGSSNSNSGSSNGAAHSPGGRFTSQKCILAGDPRDVDKVFNNMTNTFNRLTASVGAKWGLGWTTKVEK